MRRSLLLCASLLSAAVCHGASLEQPEIHFESIPEYAAKVVISRDRNAPTACDVEVSLSGQEPFSLALGESVSRGISAGNLNIELALSPAGYCGSLNLSSQQSMLVKPGATRYFQVMVSQDSIFLAPQAAPNQ